MRDDFTLRAAVRAERSLCGGRCRRCARGPRAVFFFLFVKSTPVEDKVGAQCDMLNEGMEPWKEVDIWDWIGDAQSVHRSQLIVAAALAILNLWSQRSDKSGDEDSGTTSQKAQDHAQSRPSHVSATFDWTSVDQKIAGDIAKSAPLARVRRSS